jgi:hypothetical protein
MFEVYDNTFFNFQNLKKEKQSPIKDHNLINLTYTIKFLDLLLIKLSYFPY